MRKLLHLVLLIIAAFGQSGGNTVNIPIVDADFESQPIAGYVQTITEPPGCGTDEQGKIAGWMYTPGINAGGGVAHWTCDDGAPPSNVAFLQSASMDQTLTETPHTGVYVLQFDVADWFYSYDGDWKAELYMNGSPAPFCSESGWAIGDMKRQTVTCSLPGGFVNPANANDSLSRYGQVVGNIKIHFENGLGNPAFKGHAGWPILIDNISLTFTPTN